MAPRGKKRKISDRTSIASASRDRTTNTNGSSNGIHNSSQPEVLSPPDRATWPGWVEMESEPAYFNVMLREMGVRGINVQEVLSLDEEMLAILPRPVHALIFLFRYRETDSEKQSQACAKHVWFANQTPDFACASFALLNIINNIPGLRLGEELGNFKELTKDMDPLSRGDAVDDFDFVKRIHNSFAREVNLLEADMFMKTKMDQLRKHQTAAKAKARRDAKKASKLSVNSVGETSADNAPDKSQASSRKRKLATKSPAEEALDADSDEDFGAAGETKTDGPALGDTKTRPRRSARTPKPRQRLMANEATAGAEDDDGFHFVAYMPIEDHVWKLDGLDRFPEDMGDYSADSGGDWMLVAMPALLGRMAQYAASDIQFNLMAVVHDPVEHKRSELLQNVKSLQAIEEKLNTQHNDWRAKDDGKICSKIITAASLELGIAAADCETARPTPYQQEQIDRCDELDQLLALRKKVASQQDGLRPAVRDAFESAQADDEKARHRRHNYGKFVRSWLGALAQQELLGALVEAP